MTFAARPDAPDPPLPPPALPTAGWVVGSEGRGPASGLDAGARQAARLDARLAVYAQHASALAEEAAATLAGDHVRAEALARARAAAAEHFAELQADGGPRDVGPAAAGSSFGALLSDALVELEHQAAVDLALRQRLLALRDAVSRGAGWGAEAGVPALPPPVAPDVGDGPDERDELAQLDELDEAAPVRALEGGLVAARADGVGRALAGHYPGRVTREEAATALAATERAAHPVPGTTGRSETQGRVDFTF